MNHTTTPETPETPEPTDAQMLPNGKYLHYRKEEGGGIRRWYTKDNTIHVSLMWVPRLTASKGHRYAVTVNGSRHWFDHPLEARRFVRSYFRTYHGVTVAR